MKLAGKLKERGRWDVSPRSDQKGKGTPLMLIADTQGLRSTNQPLPQKETTLEQRFKASDPVGRVLRMLDMDMVAPHKVNHVRAKMQDGRAMFSLRKR